MTLEDMKIVCIDVDEHSLFHIKSECRNLNLKQISGFHDSTKAMKHLHEHSADMIIIDYNMPELNGVGFLEKFRINNPDIPVILLMEDDVKDEVYQDAYKAGVSDFLSKPINSFQFQLRIKNLLNLRKDNILLEDKTKLLKGEIDKVTQEFNEREYEALDVISKTSEYKERNGKSHIERISHYSKMIAQGYGLSEKAQDVIFHASSFHDIGKVGILDKLFLVPRPLNDKELQLMKKHTLIGFDILRNAKDKFLVTGKRIALTHHEKYDGTGYPKGLKGHKIPIEGRIVAVADTFDALTSERPYRKALEFDEAVEYLKQQSGKHFDPDIVEIFLKNIKKAKMIFETYSQKN